MRSHLSLLKQLDFQPQHLPSAELSAHIQDGLSVLDEMDCSLSKYGEVVERTNNPRRQLLRWTKRLVFDPKDLFMLSDRLERQLSRIQELMLAYVLLNCLPLVFAFSDSVLITSQ